ncbi:hypothetical protein NDJ28_16385 [Vibrio alginolyticus]|nr:hypothetical protein [Vibrio alginolyticus]
MAFFVCGGCGIEVPCTRLVIAYFTFYWALTHRSFYLKLTS